MRQVKEPCQVKPQEQKMLAEKKSEKECEMDSHMKVSPPTTAASTNQAIE